MKTNTDFSKHRLIDESQLYPYFAKMGLTEYDAYIKRINRKILSMEPGTKLRIDPLVEEENRDLFIKMICLLINIHRNEGIDFHFNSTYTVLHRRNNIEPRKEKQDVHK